MWFLGAGCVVGVNTLGMTNDVGLNFAISSQTAQRFVDKYDPNSRQRNQSINQNVVVNPQKSKPFNKVMRVLFDFFVYAIEFVLLTPHQQRPLT